MKTPRVTDFDPNAPQPEAGEERVHDLASPLDGMPGIEHPHPVAAPTAMSTAVPAVVSPLGDPTHDIGVRPVPPVPLVPPVRGVPPKRRPIKQRHPFDIYADQLDSLRQLSLEDRKQGGIGSISAMVREALDAFLTKRVRGSSQRG